MTESQLQQNCIQWFRFQYPKYGRLLFAVPNGHKRNIVTAVKLKKEGVVAGVSDLILLVPNKTYNGLCIEMKIGKGKQTESQKEFQSDVEQTGYKYSVCRTLEEFINLINNYIYE